jgi:2-desacetyl-2-hydroxyethyl bacteriochlorophyllide A dehydrogenase
MKAAAVVFVAPRGIEVREVALPPLGDAQLLVRTCYSGISAGTELLAYRGELDPDLAVDETITALRGAFAYPFRYGYSCVGRVERSRASVPEGTLVFVFHSHQDRLVVAAEDVVPLPALDPRVATLFPFVETALQLSLDAGPLAHEPIVVLGLGAAGLLAAALMRRAGARVVGAEPRPWRRQAAAAFGVDAVAPARLPAVVDEWTGGRGVPLLVEASGNPSVLASGLQLLAHEGTALVASWYGTKQVCLPLGGAFHRRRLCIRSSQVSTIPAILSNRWTVGRRRQAALALMGELPLPVLATHEFPFTQAAEAFAAVDRGDEGLLHAALRYDG